MSDPENDDSDPPRAPRKVAIRFLLAGVAIVGAVLALAAWRARESATVERAEVEYREGDRDRALLLVNRALRREGDSADGLTLRGRCYLDRRQFAEAREDFEAAIRLAPDDAEALELLGEAWRAEENYASALDAFSRAIERDPANPERLLARGRCLLDMRDPSAALPDFEAALRLAPESAPARLHRGEARAALGDSAGALADFREAAALAPGDPSARARLGRALLEAGDARGAIAECDAALAARADYLHALVRRGQAREAVARETGTRPDGALADYSRAIEAHPKAWQPFHERGRLRFELGDAAGALEDLDRATELSGKRPRTLALRGAVRCALGDDRGAIWDWQAAYAAERGRAEKALALSSVGALRLRRGEPEAALKHCEEAIELFPEDPAHRAIQALALAARGREEEARAIAEVWLPRLSAEAETWLKAILSEEAARELARRLDEARFASTSPSRDPEGKP